LSRLYPRDVGGDPAVRGRPSPPRGPRVHMPASVGGQPDAVGRRSTRGMDYCVSDTNRADPAPSVNPTRNRETGGVRIRAPRREGTHDEPEASLEVQSIGGIPRRHESLRALVCALAQNAARADHAKPPMRDCEQ
jgi:hypothetical protein